MTTVIIEGPDGAGKSTLVQALKNADGMIETIHPGKPPENYKTLLKMLNTQLTYRAHATVVYDRVTCISEWVYRPFRITIKSDEVNECGVYFSLLEAQLALAINLDWIIVYCRPSTQRIIDECCNFTEHDTDDTMRVVKQNIQQVITAYDAIMDRMKAFGCNVVVYDYEQDDTFEFIKAILE